ncbi:RNA polymerase II transcription factor B subunit 5 [Sclerotinia borealis F-4128]|uniref:General transcription and DNA repair factor IIH subunit TFB5 n=1 Tax=Sclerotinia borealis (strain F-4128) TaxID=1432307 RepID=W9CCG3_SCLBF|nr:RNA polymerase II transcription factor B subunit 5 [Sclerotinia borealis F-4128]
MPRAIRGVLVECDPSIKSIIIKIDADSSHAYIVEDLDDETLVIKENMLGMLKTRLEEALKETQDKGTGVKTGNHGVIGDQTGKYAFDSGVGRIEDIKNRASST